MAEENTTYEYECMRAELLGIAKPDEEEFERARLERLKLEQVELEAAEAKLVEEQGDDLQNTGGKLDELNSILSSTQQKLNRFKQTACGSLSNIFGRGSVDLGDGHAPSTSVTASRRNTTASGGLCEITKEYGGDIGTALHNLDEMQSSTTGDRADDIQPRIPTDLIRNAKLDIEKKMTSHLDKLDSLLNKADQAEVSMAEQTKQMKKFTK